MSTAVLISGQMRTADLCYKSILEAHPDADFYIHAVADADACKAELFDPVRLVIEPQHEMPERREYSWQLGRGCHGVQRVLKQLWGLKRVYQVYERADCHYDWVIRCRADIAFTTPPEPERERVPDVMIPKFCNYFGLNDRYAIMRSYVARDYFARLDALDDYINAGGVFHPESFLSWALENTMEVYRTRATFDTVRADGARDLPEYKTDWRDITK